MIYGYFDESAEVPEGHCVMAGLIGRRTDWKEYLRLWKEAKGTRGPLHLRSMHLGSKTGARRYSDLLQRLGEIPAKARLLPFAGSVRTSDYVHKIKGTIAEIGLAGYNVALVSMLDSVLRSTAIPARDRIEFIFENQAVYSVHRTATFREIRKQPEYKTHHGLSRVAADRAVAKDALLEASDYLAYAVLQTLVDPDSQKAKLTAPILKAYGPFPHVQITRENAEQLLLQIYGPDGIPPMDRETRRNLLERIDKRK